MKKVMVISPYFVPMKVVGAKRALHFVRHLSEYQWSSAVMALPEDHQKDNSLNSLIPDVPMWRGLRAGPFARREDRKAQGAKNKVKSVYAAQNKQALSTTNGLKRFYNRTFNIFDRYTKFLPWVYRGALQFLEAQDCQVIYASAGPFSALKLSTLLSKRTGLPLVLDLRDPWTIEPNYQANRNRIGQWLTEWVERACFKQASKIILNTEASYRAYIATYQGVIPAERFAFIRNQFDPELYEPQADPPSSDGPFKIAYFGHLRPSKNSLLFLDAYRAWIDQYQRSPADTQVVMLGEIAHDDQQKLIELKLDEYVSSAQPIPFPKAPSSLGSMDLMLDLMGPRHHLQISGKLYDYLACGRPILSVSPNEELDQIYADTQAGQRVALSQPDIIQALEAQYQKKRSGESFTPNAEAIFQMSASPATQKLAYIFDEVTRSS
jgi:glycosyltransferase involved in cell wall biosynthesis